MAPGGTESLASVAVNGWERMAERVAININASNLKGEILTFMWICVFSLVVPCTRQRASSRSEPVRLRYQQQQHIIYYAYKRRSWQTLRAVFITILASITFVQIVWALSNNLTVTCLTPQPPAGNLWSANILSTLSECECAWPGYIRLQCNVTAR